MKDETLPKINNKEKLARYSTITLFEFYVLFLNLIDTLSLSDKHAELIFEFIKLIIPDNNIILSYYKFKKAFEHNSTKQISLCNFCEEKIEKNVCSNEFCASHGSRLKKKSSKLVLCDIEMQLKKIILKNYDKILEYKSKLK